MVKKAAIFNTFSTLIYAILYINKIVYNIIPMNSEYLMASVKIAYNIQF